MRQERFGASVMSGESSLRRSEEFNKITCRLAHDVLSSPANHVAPVILLVRKGWGEREITLLTGHVGAMDSVSKILCKRIGKLQKIVIHIALDVRAGRTHHAPVQADGARQFSPPTTDVQH